MSPALRGAVQAALVKDVGVAFVLAGVAAGAWYSQVFAKSKSVYADFHKKLDAQKKK